MAAISIAVIPVPVKAVWCLGGQGGGFGPQGLMSVTMRTEENGLLRRQKTKRETSECSLLFFFVGARPARTTTPPPRPSWGASHRAV